MNLLISFYLVLLLLLYTCLFNKSYHVFIFLVSIKSRRACFLYNFWKLTSIKLKFMFCFTMRMCLSNIHIRRTRINSFLFYTTCHSSVLTFTLLRASWSFDEIIFVSSLRRLLLSFYIPRTILMMNTIINLSLSRSLLRLTHHIYRLAWKLNHVVQFYSTSRIWSSLFCGVKRR